MESMERSESIDVIEGTFPAPNTCNSAAKQDIARALKFVYAASLNAELSGVLKVHGSDDAGMPCEATVKAELIDEAARELSDTGGLYVDFKQPENLISLRCWSIHLDENDGRAGAQKLTDHLNEIGFRAVGRHNHSSGRWIIDVCAVTAAPFQENDEIDYKFHELMQFDRSFRSSMSEPEDQKVSVLARLIGDDDPTELAARLAMSSERIEWLLQNWSMVGRSIDLFGSLSGVASERPQEQVTFCVEGLLPNGMITLLAGTHEAGKSTLAHELAIVVGGGHQSTWLGQPVTGRGLAVYLAGEDSAGSIAERRRSLDPDGDAQEVCVMPSDSRSINKILDGLRNAPDLRLLVIDPARKYIEGDEDSSEYVDRLLTALQDFAVEKSCAVVLVHHLRKNAKPQNVKAVHEAIRGSGVFSDRPRIILGMLRRGDQVTVGVCKNNLPPSCGIVREPITCDRDRVTLRHTPVGIGVCTQESRGADAPKSSEEATDLLESTMTALRDTVASGKRVTSTGKYELFQWGHAALKGVTREKVRAAVKSLIIQGLVVAEGAQLVPAE